MTTHRGIPVTSPVQTLVDLATELPAMRMERAVDEADKRVEVDFYWPELGLVIETDGLQYHRTPFAQSDDLERDQTHTASGLRSLRFSHYQVRYEPAHVVKVLRDTAKHLRR